MFTKQKTEDHTLQDLAEIVKRKLVDDNTTPEEFAKILDQYNKLAALQHASKRDSRVSADVLATIGANLAGIVLILQHERAHVVASKAVAFIQKLR